MLGKNHATPLLAPVLNNVYIAQKKMIIFCEHPACCYEVPPENAGVDLPSIVARCAMLTASKCHVQIGSGFLLLDLLLKYVPPGK
jgi:hypothetical protein